MITKGHWNKFCAYVNVAKTLNLQPHIKGQRVYEVNVTTNEIVAIGIDKTRIRYKHPDSLENYHDLPHLYSTITFNGLTTLKDIMRFTSTAQSLLKSKK